jgi:methylglutaconyl-CoA hydratase
MARHDPTRPFGDDVPTILTSVDARGVATLRFNRPDKANSYDQVMLDALAAWIEQCREDAAVRVLVLRGEGKHFSAGAAIASEADRARSVVDAARRRIAVGISEVCASLDAIPKPTLAAVQGACIGGALALAWCCEVVIAGRDATFAIPEVRLGFAPGPLIPFFLRALGYRNLRRYLLSGERFAAAEAHRIGVVHELCETGALEQHLDAMIDETLMAAPGAVARAKQVLRAQVTPAISADALRKLQVAFKAAARSDEAEEGRRSFKEKRKPSWYRGRE